MKKQIVTVLLFAALLMVMPHPANAQMSIETFTVGSYPYGVAFDGTSIWVTNFGSNTVTRMRESDGACVVNGTVQPNLSACTFNVESEPIALAADGAYIWVANYASSSVTMLRASDGSCNGVVNPPTAVGCTIPVGTNPRFLVSDGANIWVANQGSSSVYKIQASNGMLLGTFNVGQMPSGLAFDGTNIWVANYLSNTVSKLRASDGLVLNTFSVSSPHGLVFDGSNIWVTNDVSTNGTVTRLRAYDGACLNPCVFSVGSNPIGAAFDGTNIWVTNYSSNTVSGLRASDGASVGTFNVGPNPAGIAADGSNLWTANTAGTTVSELFPTSPNPNTYLGWPTQDWGCDTGSNVGPCWSLGYVPDGANLNDCLIPAGLNVNADGGDACINLTVAAGDTLRVNPGYLVVTGPKINNAGTIANDTFNGLTVSAPVTFLSGGGWLYMTTLPGQLPTLIRAGTGNITLFNVDNTILGQGSIGALSLNLINQKTIVAAGGQLVTYGNSITNTGVLQAAQGSALKLTGPLTNSPVINNTFGTISALDTGTVVLGGGTVNGGVLTTSGSGVIQTATPVTYVTLNGVTNSGAYANYAVTTLQGTVTNNGTIYAPNGGVRVAGTATLQGTGILSSETHQAVTYPLIGSNPGTAGAVLINQSTISGGGGIGDSGLSINNQGTINATNASTHLILTGPPTMNPGLMEASGGATLEIGTTVNNSGGTITAQSGSFVLLGQNYNFAPASVNGGTLIADGTITGPLTAAGGHQLGLSPGMMLLGQGTVVGDVTSFGTVFPGDSVAAPGLLAIQGNYTQYANSVLSVAIDVCSPILPCHDPLGVSQLAISKVATLGGTLKVTIGNRPPQIGDKFTILTASSVQGHFGNGYRLPINANEHFAITYGSTSVTLTVAPGP